MVASEPLLADPVAMAFDARGRIFVCEIHGYNLEGYYDILELNKTGVLDTKVRRVDASPEAATAGRGRPVRHGQAAGGHRRRRAIRQVDGLGRPAAALLRRGAGARRRDRAICPPDILFLADRDGDGKAEVREKLYHRRRPDVEPAQQPAVEHRQLDLLRRAATRVQARR